MSKIKKMMIDFRHLIFSHPGKRFCGTCTCEPVHIIINTFDGVLKLNHVD